MNRCSGSGSAASRASLCRLLQFSRTLHHRELVPAGEVCEIALRHRQDLAEGFVLSALAELRRNDLVDDAIVEGIAGNADAGMAERARAHPAATFANRRWKSRWCRRRSRQPARPHPGAAAAQRRTPRRPARTHTTRRAVRAGRTPPGSGPWRAHRPDCRRRNGPAGRPRSGCAPSTGESGIAPQGAKERRQQILECEALAEDARVLERGARREGLERLDEAMRAGPLEELLDRPRPALDARLQRAVASFLPEEKRRHVDAEQLAAAVELERLGASVRMRNGDHGVGRPEVDADGRAGAGCCHDGTRDE